MEGSSDAIIYQLEKLRDLMQRSNELQKRVKKMTESPGIVFKSRNVRPAFQEPPPEKPKPKPGPIERIKSTVSDRLFKDKSAKDCPRLKTKVPGHLKREAPKPVKSKKPTKRKTKQKPKHVKPLIHVDENDSDEEFDQQLLDKQNRFEQWKQTWFKKSLDETREKMHKSIEKRSPKKSAPPPIQTRPKTKPVSTTHDHNTKKPQQPRKLRGNIDKLVVGGKKEKDPRKPIELAILKILGDHEGSPKSKSPQRSQSVPSPRPVPTQQEQEENWRAQPPDPRRVVDIPKIEEPSLFRDDSSEEHFSEEEEPALLFSSSDDEVIHQDLHAKVKPTPQPAASDSSDLLEVHSSESSDSEEMGTLVEVHSSESEPEANQEMPLSSSDDAVNEPKKESLDLHLSSESDVEEKPTQANDLLEPESDDLFGSENEDQNLLQDIQQGTDEGHDSFLGGYSESSASDKQEPKQNSSVDEFLMLEKETHKSASQEEEEEPHVASIDQQSQQIADQIFKDSDEFKVSTSSSLLSDGAAEMKGNTDTSQIANEDEGDSFKLDLSESQGPHELNNTNTFTSSTLEGTGTLEKDESDDLEQTASIVVDVLGESEPEKKEIRSLDDVSSDLNISIPGDSPRNDAVHENMEIEEETGKFPFDVDYSVKVDDLPDEYHEEEKEDITIHAVTEPDDVVQSTISINSDTGIEGETKSKSDIDVQISDEEPNVDIDLSDEEQKIDVQISDEEPNVEVDLSDEEQKIEVQVSDEKPNVDVDQSSDSVDISMPNLDGDSTDAKEATIDSDIPDDIEIDEEEPEFPFKVDFVIDVNDLPSDYHEEKHEELVIPDVHEEEEQPPQKSESESFSDIVDVDIGDSDIAPSPEKNKSTTVDLSSEDVDISFSAPESPKPKASDSDSGEINIDEEPLENEGFPFKVDYVINVDDLPSDWTEEKREEFVIAEDPSSQEPEFQVDVPPEPESSQIDDVDISNFSDDNEPSKGVVSPSLAVRIEDDDDFNIDGLDMNSDEHVPIPTPTFKDPVPTAAKNKGIDGIADDFSVDSDEVSSINEPVEETQDFGVDEPVSIELEMELSDGGGNTENKQNDDDIDIQFSSDFSN